MTADVEDHPSSPATPGMRLRQFLNKEDEFSAVLIVAMRKDDSSAEVTWSQMALNDLAFLERALTSSITQEFTCDDD